MIERVILERGSYHDPVTLLQASNRARTGDGVAHVAVGMANPLNLAVIATRHGYDLGGEDDLGPNDLVIGVRAETEHAAETAVEIIHRHLARRRREREVADVGPYVYVQERDGRSRRIEKFDRPAEPDAEPALRALAQHAGPIAWANDEAVRRMQDASPLVVGVGYAGDLLPGMTERTLLHAGPPIDWSGMSGPMRGAVIGAALFEGLASSPEEVARKAQAGEFEFAPGHDRNALGPMAGVISHSMPMWIVENATHGNRACCTFSEGLGQMLRFGAYGEEVIDRLRWMRSVLAPVTAAALARLPAPLDIRAMTAQAVQMGDEGHNRNRAGASLLIRELAPALLEVDMPSADVVEAVRFLALSDYTYLNLTMPAGKVTADAASGVERSTIVTVMARNGTEFGVRTSGTGDRWFTAPSNEVEGLWLPGYQSTDANRDMGDSTITETIGLGGFALAAAPGIGLYVGTSAEEAMRATLSMYEITWSESVNYRIPALGFRGTPLGIDCRRVVNTGIAPVIDTGIAHNEAGVGVIGGGIVRAPMGAFLAATQALAEMA